MPSYVGAPSVYWPGDRDREALVRLRVLITEDGKPEDIEVAAGSFYAKRFLDTSVRALKAMRFHPGTLDGKPVAMRVIVPFAFFIGAGGGNKKWAQGITEDFRAELAKVDKLLKQGDYAGADFHAEWMVREKVTLGYEYAVLKALLANTHAAVGHDLEALAAAEDATRQTTPRPTYLDLYQTIPQNSPYNYILDEKAVVPLLELRVRLAAKHGMLPQALLAYDELVGLKRLAPADPYVVLAEKITEKLEGIDPLTTDGMINDGHDWGFPLYRPDFELDRVHGTVAFLLLNCEAHDKKLRYTPGEIWTIPAGWQNCVVNVTGKNDTTFEFVQHLD